MGKMDENKRRKILNYAVFGVFLILYSCMTYRLFYRQAIEYQGIYYSDMKAYILETQGMESGYDFPYPLFFWISRIWMLVVSPEQAVAFSTMLLNSLGIVALKVYFDRRVPEHTFLCTLAVFSVFFMSMIYSPRGHSFWGFDYTYRCMGILTPNPYWNATYLAVRPFTILAFFQAVKVLQEYEERFSWKSAAWLGGFVFLATFTKPSFTMVFLPTVGVVLLYRLLKSRFANLKNTFFLCCFFIPTGILLLYQYFGVFTGTNSHGEESGIGFEAGKAWLVYSDNIPLSLVMALAFPITVLCLNLLTLKKNGELRLAWQIWVAGFLGFLFLYEKGFRFSHMNFSWGYMHGLFFVFAVSVLQLLLNLCDGEKKLSRLKAVPELVMFFYHLVCGIVFFVYLYQGNNAGWF